MKAERETGILSSYQPVSSAEVPTLPEYVEVLTLAEYVEIVAAIIEAIDRKK